MSSTSSSPVESSTRPDRSTTSTFDSRKVPLQHVGTFPIRLRRTRNSFVLDVSSNYTGDLLLSICKAPSSRELLQQRAIRLTLLESRSYLVPLAPGGINGGPLLSLPDSSFCIERLHGQPYEFSIVPPGIYSPSCHLFFITLETFDRLCSAVRNFKPPMNP